MLKAIMSDGTILLGIDKFNIECLTTKKMPLLLEADEKLGLPRDIVVVYGETLEDVIQQLKQAGVGIPPVEEWHESEG